MSLRAWPQDDVEHELETLSAWLRIDADCPPEVRIREQEGTFDRPSILIRHDSTGYIDGGKYYWQSTRACNIMWYGSLEEDIPDLHLEKNRALSWLSKKLTRENDIYRGVVQVSDFSRDPAEPVDYHIVIDDSSVDVSPRRDEYGLWYIAASFNYSVERGPDESSTLITDVVYEYEGIE